MEFGEPIPARYATEFRFTPNPLILNRGGQLAADFHGDPFIHWRISSTPFRVELHDEPRTKIAFTTFRSIGMEMEATDTFQMFSDHAGRWLRAAMSNQILGRNLPIERSGFRAWLFTPVNATSLEEFAQHISTRFLTIQRLFEAEELSPYQMVDNAIVLNLSSGENRINVTFGPIGKEEAKTKKWIQTDQGQGLLSDLSFAVDVDVYRTSEKAADANVQDLIRFIREARELAESVNRTLIKILRG